MKKKFFIIPPLLFLIAMLVFLTFHRASQNKGLSKSNPGSHSKNIAIPVDPFLFFPEERSEIPEGTVTTRICPHCNATNSTKSQYCIRCGRSLQRPK